MTWMDDDGNIHHVRGDDFLLTLTDFKEDGVAINWTGWNILIQAREKPASVNKVIEFTNTDMDLSTPGIMIITKAKTACNFLPKVYVCDWQFTSPSSKTDTWLYNKKFIMHEDVSR